MSMKSSIAYKEFTGKKKKVHIYLDMMDDRYYIEDEKGYHTCLPKEIAKKFAKVINEM